VLTNKFLSAQPAKGLMLSGVLIAQTSALLKAELFSLRVVSAPSQLQSQFAVPQAFAAICQLIPCIPPVALLSPVRTEWIGALMSATKR
jgi:hypothetical protein